MEQASVEKDAVTTRAVPEGRAYRMTWSFRIYAIVCLSFGIALAVGARTVPLVVLAFLLALVGALLTVKAFSSRIRFTGDSVELNWALRRRSLPLSSIRGRREYASQGRGSSTRYLRPETNDGRPPLDFGKKLYRFDEAFWQWFNQLPDLDARDKERTKNSNFGLI